MVNIDPIVIPLKVFTPYRINMRQDSSFEVTAADLHKCPIHHVVQPEAVGTEPAPPFPKFTFVTDDPTSSDAPPSSPLMLDNGATRHSQANESSASENFAVYISFCSDPADPIIDMNSTR